MSKKRKRTKSKTEGYNRKAEKRRAVERAKLRRLKYVTFW